MSDAKRMANILVTGAGGALGGHLVKRLLNDGHNVRAVDIKPADDWWQRHFDTNCEIISDTDLSTAEACRDAVDGVDWVYNLAADMGGMGFIETHRADCMLTVLINTNLIRAAARAGIARYWYASSACAYAAMWQDDPEDGYLLLREDQAHPAAPEPGYGWEKLFSELMCSYAGEDWGLTTRIARIHNVYGPCSTWDGGREKAPAAICRKVARAKLTGDHRIEVWGDGTRTRSFLYVDDFVEGAIRIMESDYGRPLNLGSDEVVTVEQLVETAEAAAGFEPGTLERVYNLTAPLGVQGRGSDNTRIKAVLNWAPTTKLRDGIQKLYDWVEPQVEARGYATAHAEHFPPGHTAIRA